MFVCVDVYVRCPYIPTTLTVQHADKRDTWIASLVNWGGGLNMHVGTSIRISVSFGIILCRVHAVV